MTTIIRLPHVILLLTLLSPTLGHSEEHDAHATGVESLSAGLRDLLKKEMIALEKGMLAIFPAYVAGEMKKIENIAHDMKNSFILKQELTDAQAHELHTVLPQPFIALDQNFHYLSGMLEHVAERKKTELVGFYIAKLSEACVSCHSQYATHKFPAFISKKEKHEH